MEEDTLLVCRKSTLVCGKSGTGIIPNIHDYYEPIPPRLQPLFGIFSLPTAQLLIQSLNSAFRLLVFSVTLFDIDQNKNQNRSINKVQNLGTERW